MREERSLTDGLADVDPRARRRRGRRALLITAIVLAVMLGSVGGYTGWALTAPLADPVVVYSEPGVPASAPSPLALPAEGAAAISVSGADDYFGPAASGIWATSGSAEPRPIASITKLITALVILDARPLASAADPGPTITFSKADHDLYDEYYVRGATIAAMPTGSSMSQHDALATMLIPSASNYAEAVSTWAFGSQGAFLDAARRWLAANGLTSTTIVEPTGLSPRNTSTPTDLIALGRLAAANPTIAELAATSALALPGPGIIVNTNGLLGTEGITGLKTGNLGDGTYNLLYTAALDVGIGRTLSVTGVMLGGMSRSSVDRDVLALLGSIRAGFHQVPVATRGQQVGTYETSWGSSGRMVIDDDVSILTWSDTPITMAMDAATPKSYADGEEVGTITWTAGPNTVAASVRIEGSLAPPTEWWRLTHPGELTPPWG